VPGRAALRRVALSPEEAAAVLGVSRASLYRALARGELPRRKGGRRTLVAVADLARLAGMDVEELLELMGPGA
jgi:excisionase family DNA binding protein